LTPPKLNNSMVTNTNDSRQRILRMIIRIINEIKANTNEYLNTLKKKKLKELNAIKKADHETEIQ
jgi:hypothetical protein